MAAATSDLAAHICPHCSDAWSRLIAARNVAGKSSAALGRQLVDELEQTVLNDFRESAVSLFRSLGKARNDGEVPPDIETFLGRCRTLGLAIGRGGGDARRDCLEALEELQVAVIAVCAELGDLAAFAKANPSSPLPLIRCEEIKLKG